MSIDEYGAHSLLLGDTNPAGPAHWLWKDVINNVEMLITGFVRAFAFNFYSNPSLSEEYREMLRTQFGPGSLWYKRQIEGLWVMAEGVIYAMVFDEDRNSCAPGLLPNQFDELFCAVDYGTTNTFVLALYGIYAGKTYLIDAYSHDSEKKGTRTNGQYLSDCVDFIQQYNRHYGQRISQLIIDPSAASFKAELDDWVTDDDVHRKWRNLGITVVDAENDVEMGVKFMASKLYCGDFIICRRPTTEIFFSEIGVYAWDSKAQERGIDQPIKKNDHMMDACRYALLTRHIKRDPFAGWR